MSASTGAKVLAVLAFVVIGLPAGLCTLVYIPGMFAVFFIAENKAEAVQVTAVGLVSILIFGGIFYFSLRWVIRVFSS